MSDTVALLQLSEVPAVQDLNSRLQSSEAVPSGLDIPLLAVECLGPTPLTGGSGPMRTALRFRVLLAVVAALMALVWALSPSFARPPAAALVGAVATGGGMAGADSEPRAQKVYVGAPLNGEVAKTWTKLSLKVPMMFPQETPLEDVIKYIRSATAEAKDNKGSGLQFYIDPVGLQEAERTITSPVTIELDGLPLSTTLELMLKQLGLVYTVQKDGLVIITSKDSDDVTQDPTALILEELGVLRKEVKELRAEVIGLRGGHPSPEASPRPNAMMKVQPAMGGGFR
jgi:hypothetical protein